MDPLVAFEKQVRDNISALSKDKDLQGFSRIWSRETNKHNYTYNFSWLGRPIIQYPQDIVALQEIIWQVKPDLIIETGIAHGGSLILSASMLALLDLTEAVKGGKTINPSQSDRLVVGIDIDIREHNRRLIESHSLASRIKMFEGSSVENEIIDRVTKIASKYNSVLVCLDSMHTHDHVLKELVAYAPLVSKGSYCIVFDTLIEDMPIDMFKDKPWFSGK